MKAVDQAMGPTALPAGHSRMTGCSASGPKTSGKDGRDGFIVEGGLGSRSQVMMVTVGQTMALPAAAARKRYDEVELSRDTPCHSRHIQNCDQLPLSCLF